MQKKINPLLHMVYYEALLGVMGNRGIMSFISGEHKPKNEGNRETNVILGGREHRKLRFGEHGKMLKYFKRVREQVPQPPPSHPHWEGLYYVSPSERCIVVVTVLCLPVRLRQITVLWTTPTVTSWHKTKCCKDDWRQMFEHSCIISYGQVKM